jgi:flagellar biosynthetic protein FliQ
MEVETVISLVNEALQTAMLISAPVLLTALVVGLLISLFQAVTQIQEMTLTFIPKILVSLLVMLMFLPWMIQILMEFVRRLFDRIPTLIG